jgi:hypothetical protein
MNAPANSLLPPDSASILLRRVFPQRGLGANQVPKSSPLSNGAIARVLLYRGKIRSEIRVVPTSGLCSACHKQVPCAHARNKPAAGRTPTKTFRTRNRGDASNSNSNTSPLACRLRVLSNAEQPICTQSNELTIRISSHSLTECGSQQLNPTRFNRATSLSCF